MRFMFLLLMVGVVAGCHTTNFPIGQTPPTGMSTAIQQQVISDAVEAAVADLKIEPTSNWESTAMVRVESPFSVYSTGGGGSDQGVVGYVRTMVEIELTKKGFHIISGDVEPDWEIVIEVRTAGAEVKEEDFVVMQRKTLKAVVSCRLYIHKMSGGDKPYYVSESEVISEPYLWGHSILYIFNMPDVKYRAMGESSMWDRLFGLQQDASAGFSQASQFQQQIQFAR